MQVAASLLNHVGYWLRPFFVLLSGVSDGHACVEVAFHRLDSFFVVKLSFGMKVLVCTELDSRVVFGFLL
jgi:hypothetical protein